MSDEERDVDIESDVSKKTLPTSRIHLCLGTFVAFTMRLFSNRGSLALSLFSLFLASLKPNFVVLRNRTNTRVCAM